MLLNAIECCKVVRKADILSSYNSLGPCVFDHYANSHLVVVSLCM